MSGIPDRRLHLRQQVRSLTYVDLGQNNGGIVLNLSEGGLAVQAASILTTDHFPHMRIKLPQRSEWLEASGQLAWTSESGKEAGVRFVEISDDARFQIRQWVSLGGPADEIREENRKRHEQATKPFAPVENRPVTRAIPEQVAPNVFRKWPTRVSVSDEPVAAVADSELSPVHAKPALRNQDLVHSLRNNWVGPAAYGSFGSFTSLDERRDYQGWGLAVVFSLLAVGSLAAGMALERGDLGGVLGKLQDDVGGVLSKLAPQRNVPAAQSPVEPSPPDSSSQKAAPSPSDRTAPDVTEIEVLDANNRRWRIPLNGAPNAQTPGVSTSESAAAGTPVESADNAPVETVESPAPVPKEGSERAPREANVRIETWILSPAISPEKMGQPIYRVDPVYPPEAEQQRIEGEVKLRAIVGRDGTVQSVGVVDGPALLVPAAMDAVRRWRYAPTFKNGRSVEVEQEILIEFRLRG